MAPKLKEDLFLSSRPYTLGIELELQLIDPTSKNLVPAAAKLIDGLADKLFPVKLKMISQVKCLRLTRAFTQMQINFLKKCRGFEIPYVTLLQV
jgi:hypothetical protein